MGTRSQQDYGTWERQKAFLKHKRASFTKELRRIFKADEDGDDDDDEGIGEFDIYDLADLDQADVKRAQELASLILEAGAGALNRGELLHYLLRTEAGRSLMEKHYVAQAKRRAAKRLMPSRDQMLAGIAKQDFCAVCKSINDQGATDLNEGELTALASADAMRTYPALGKDAAFAKKYGDAASPGYAEFWKAIAISKGADLLSIMPVQVGGEDAADVNTDASKAYEQLVGLAEQQRARSPDLSKAQAFARVFAANPELAERAHRRPAPTTSYAWPK